MAHGAHQPGQAHGKGDHGKHVIQRTAPVDEGLAKRNLKAVMEMFGDVRRDQLKFKEAGGTHGKLSDAQKDAFTKRYPGLPVPTSVVFGKDGSKPIGVVYSNKQKPDLGMGNAHQHGDGKNFMQHIWFTPDDMNLAFSDTEKGASKRANDIVNGGGGAPAKK